MRRVLVKPCHLESLESRQLCSVATSPHGAGEGVDIQFLSDVESDTTPTITETPESFARVGIPGGFKWFDSTSTQDLISNGGQLEYVMVDGWNIWPRDANGAHRDGEPSEVNTRWLANYAVTVTSTLIIDIENWAMDVRYYSPSVVNQNIARFQNIIGWIREEQPDLKIGIYSLFPVSDLYNTVQYELYSQLAVDPVAGFWYRGALPATSNNFAKLQNSNAFLAGLASQVDYIFPAIYTSSPDIDLWNRYAINTIHEARRYGKPVIPLIMPTYHAGAAGLNMAVVQPAMWQDQLNLLPQYADGGIIWTDPLAPTGSDEYWIQMAINTINGNGARTSSVSVGSLNTDAGTTPRSTSKRFSDSFIHDLL